MRNYILIAALLLSACGEDGVVHGVDSGTCDLVTCEDNAELVAECGLECPDKLCDIVTCEDSPTLIAECGLECVDPCEAVVDCEDPLAAECGLICPDPCEGVTCEHPEAAECGLECVDPCEGVVCGSFEAWACGKRTPCRGAICDDERCLCHDPAGPIEDAPVVAVLDANTCELICDPTEIIGTSDELIGYRVYSATFTDVDWLAQEPANGTMVFVGYGEVVYATSWSNGTAYWDGGAFVPLETVEAWYGSKIVMSPVGESSGYHFDLEAETYVTCTGHCGYDISVDIEKEFAPVYKTCE